MIELISQMNITPYIIINSSTSSFHIPSSISPLRSLQRNSTTAATATSNNESIDRYHSLRVAVHRRAYDLGPTARRQVAQRYSLSLRCAATHQKEIPSRRLGPPTRPSSKIKCLSYVRASFWLQTKQGVRKNSGRARTKGLKEKTHWVTGTSPHNSFQLAEDWRPHSMDSRCWCRISGFTQSQSSTDDPTFQDWQG